MNSRVSDLLKSINMIVEKDADDDLKELIRDFPVIDKLVKAVDDYETIIAKLLRYEKKTLVKALKQYIDTGSTDNPIVSAMLEMNKSDILEKDDFDKKLSDASKSFLTATVAEITTEVMDMIDKDVQFNILSPRTTNWIEDWSDELGKLMKLSSHKGVERAITRGLEDGAGIEEIIRELQDLPEFDRKRARATAITEVLTANSVSQQEAYLQSPAVEKKRWLHSGARGIDPRPAHVALSGTEVDVDAEFSVNGYDAKYPRDTNLPASERVYCHCVLQPVVDEKILGLSKQEKELIRQRALS